MAKGGFKELYVLNNLYAFSRGDVVVAITNKGDTVDQEVDNTPFNDGEEVCNIFHKSDCVRVSGKKIKIHLENQETKIYTRGGNTSPAKIAVE